MLEKPNETGNVVVIFFQDKVLTSEVFFVCRKQKRIRTVVDNDAKFQSKKTSKKKNKGNFFM